MMREKLEALDRYNGIEKDPEGVYIMRDEALAILADVEHARLKCIEWAREEQERAEIAEASNGRLVAALKVLSKCAKKFQMETDEKKRNGRIWDALYEAIEKADAALAEARKEKTP